jgi:polysaccharide biosynthesis/export protein
MAAPSRCTNIQLLRYFPPNDISVLRPSLIDMRQSDLFVAARQNVVIALVCCVLVCAVPFSLYSQSPVKSLPQDKVATSGNAGPTYVLGAGDEISVWVAQLEQLSGRSFTIDRDGCVTLPLAGRLHLEGLTVPQAQELMRTSLSQYVRDPEVGISLLQAKNEGISITGSVARPGVYQLAQGKTLVAILMAAGGIQQNAGPWAIIMRPLTSGRISLPAAHDDSTHKFSLAEVNVREVMGLQHSAENIEMMPGDTVSVPEAQMVYVVGDVNKPGGFPVNDEQQTTALQLLAMAGGPLRSAAPEKAKVLRSSRNGQKPILISINLKQLLRGKSPDLRLQPSDVLFVPNSAEKAVAARAIDAALQTGLFALTYGVIYR